MRVRFGSFVFDSGTRELVHHPAPGDPGSRARRAPDLRQGAAGQSAPRQVHLSPKAFDVLEILLARRPNVVSKDVLLKEVWPGKIVEEANLAIVVGEIRKALGDDSRLPAVIVTVPRHGYRFAAEARDLDGPAGDRYARWWLSWNDKTFPLREGDNIVGRHPSSGVWIDGTSVSRVHARIVATPGKVVVEDRGSRNGTFVDGKRVTEPQALADGNTVTFGSESTIFREWSDEGAAGTEPVRR